MVVGAVGGVSGVRWVRWVRGVGWVAPVAVLRVRVGGEGRLLGVGGRSVVLVRRVLHVGRRVVVVVVVVGRRVLPHLAELGVVHLGLGLGVGARRVVQVGRVRRVGDQGGVQRRLGGRAGGLDPPGAEDGAQQRGGVGEGLLAARRAVTAGRGSPPHVGAANDRPFHIAV